MEYLENLNEQEIDQLTDAVSYVTILIAGADGNIDSEETAWANKLTKIRGYASADALQGFYDKVGTNFSERLTYLIGALPDETNARTAAISTEMEKLNPILAKLDQRMGHALYASFTSFAKHVAESSGGFFRFGTISKEEAALIDLPMLTPIEEPIEPEQ